MRGYKYMPPFEKTPYNANVEEFFTSLSKESTKSEKKRKKMTGVFIVDSDVCG